MEIEPAGGSHTHGAGGTDGLRRGEERGTYLVWEDLTVVLPNFTDGPTKRLLNGLRGYAEPGRIMAIMGPSGSGKSTLLDTLAGRLSKNVVMTGTILFNGKKRKLGYGDVAYVTQEDILLGTLTVRETISYSAQLRLPNSMTKDELDSIVDATILEMGLQDCADRLIGNWHLRGISGGEKKRLSVAVEILTRPRLLFLDEPTSGLDSASAFFVIQTLRNVARDGRTVVSSIHQPSSEVFALFDDLFLLSGGEAVYFGEAKMAVQFFAEANFPCPSRRNPSDHFLRCINSDFDIVTATLKGSLRIRDIPESSDPFINLATAQIKSMLVEKYRSSKYASRVKARIREISTIEGLEVENEKGDKASWFKQLSTLTRRSFVNMCRDVGYYWLRIIIYVIVSLCVGTIYFNVGTSYTAIFARGACGAFITGFMTFMTIGGFPSFIEEMKMFYRERLNGYYGVTVFILSNFISSFPFLVSISVVSGTITFYMVKYRPEFSRYLFFCLNIFGCISVIEGLMMVVASLVPNFLMGIITGAGIIGIMMMTSGFFRLLPDLPKPFWRYPISYLSYGSWALQGAYKNDLIGLEFDPMIPGMPRLSGEYVITNMYGIPINHSKWWDLAAVMLLGSSSIRSLLTRNFFFSVRSLSSSPLLSNTRFFPDSKQTLLHIPQFPSVTRFVSPINSRSSLIASFLTRLDHTMATPSKTSVHDFTVKDAKGNDVDLSAYKGKVLLIVNVASQCGLTNSNYTELSQLYEKYKGHGFEILAFPCNQFGGQEPGSNEEIVQFACTRFKAEYPIFDKVDVNGNNAAPLYKFLKSSKGGLFGDAIKWNFSKFLVDKDGNVVDRYAPTTSPLSIEKDVKKLLGIA